MWNRIYWATVGILIGLAFGFTFGGVGSPFADGEAVTSSNMNEIDTALDNLEAGTSIAAALTRDTEWDTIGEIETAVSVNIILSTEIDTMAELEAIAAGANIIVSTEIDTIGEVETLLGAVNVLLETEIDASAELRALMDDESGTGALIFAAGDIGAATATTASAEDNDTSVATTAYVQGEFGDLGAYTVGTSAPTDGSTACTNGDMYLDESANKIYFCVDSATDDWFGVALTDTP